MSDLTPVSEGRYEQVCRERDLFERLLNLGGDSNLDRLLDACLNTIVEATNAELGYLQFAPVAGVDPRWARTGAVDSEALAEIRGRISTSIVTETLGSGKTVQTASAVLDNRFADRPSVRENRIEAVLCAPIAHAAVTGVLYLQGRAGAGPFAERDVALVRVFAKAVAVVADRAWDVEEMLRDADATAKLRRELNVGELIGRSQALAHVLEQIRQVAPRATTVLITGASGTGKTIVARALHASGGRAHGPFVELNCAVVADELAESELFGHVKGAFTGATSSRAGKVDAARGGTLFLDEVGELSPRLQAKLLQLLEAKTYFPLGSDEVRHADIRVLAATNRDLAEMVRDKTFREDLYHRLGVFPIHMPDLDARPGDVPLLAAHFAQRCAEREQLSPLPLSGGALHALRSRDWSSGQVRELANMVERGYIRAHSENSSVIRLRHLFPPPPDSPSPQVDDEDGGSYHEQLARCQRRLLEAALRETNGNVSQAAKRLKIARSTMNNLLRELDVRRA